VCVSGLEWTGRGRSPWNEEWEEEREETYFSIRSSIAGFSLDWCLGE
jgi:hypothetical protein